jgi:two-component system, NarL family, sensor kinase
MAPTRAEQRPRNNGAAALPRRALWSHPVVLFVAAGAVTVILLLLILSWFSEKAATDEAITEARSVTDVLAHSVAEPAIPAGLVDGNAAALDRFDNTVLHRLLVDDIVRIKIWTADGRIVYSDKVQLIGERFTLDAEDRGVLTHGGSSAGVSNLQDPENRYEQGSGKLLQVYTRVHDPSGQPLLFEAYFPYSKVSDRSSQILSEFRPITVAGLLVFLLLTVPLVWALARRLDRSAADRERLLLAVVEASDSERRRIARDLHDGVVQELVGISFAVSATSRQLTDQPGLSGRLDALGVGVRRSLRALRSLLVEIYPPELQENGLAAALEDLLAPATAAGIDVDVDVADTSQVTPEWTALIWRVAQEAVRNALRHGHPTRLSVLVTTPPDGVGLEVRDDGAGFDPAADPPYGHLGLRSLRDLVSEAGGSLDITSAPGRGTTVVTSLTRA